MGPPRRLPWIWVIASALLIVGPFLTGSLAALLLDRLAHRSAYTGSLTTMFPGFVYATATIMKVCLVAGVFSIPVGLGQWIAAGRAAIAATPLWALASLALTPATILVGAVAVLAAQRWAGPVSRASLDEVSRSAVFVMMVLLAVAAIAALVSLVRRERPRLLAAFGLAVNIALLVLFWQLEFFARGFDQDTWAPR
jgi:hypothetical protein